MEIEIVPGTGSDGKLGTVGFSGSGNDNDLGAVGSFSDDRQKIQAVAVRQPHV